MIKLLFVFLVFGGVIGGFSVSVLAQSDDPSLLPHSPFYFLKELGRTVQKIFAFTNVGKVEVALEIAEAKMAELRKVQDTMPDNIDAVSRALEKYVKNVSYLQSKLEKLKDAEVVQRTDQAFNSLIAVALRHQQIFDELRARFEFLSDLKSDLDRVQDSISATLSLIPDFERRFYFALDKDGSPLKELRFAEVLDRLEEKLEPESRSAAIKLKEDLLLRFSGRLEAQAFLPETQAILPILGEAPGDQLRRLEILDEIRESVMNPDLKSQLNVVRQRILDNSQKAGSINSKKAEQAIADAEGMSEEVKSLIAASSDAPKSIKQLADRADFNLVQSSDLFKQGNYGGAYGQATAALAAYKNIVLRLTVASGDYERDVKDLKKRFDSLLSEAKERGFSDGEYPKLFDLFKEGEKKIVELSKIVDSGKGSEKIIQNLRVAKLILATIEELFRNFK